MEIVAAALVLAWVAIILLAFAMAGMLHQLRDVQSALARRTVSGGIDVPQELPDAVKPESGRSHAAVLLVDDSCAICAEAVPAFASVAGTGSPDIDFLLLSRKPLEKLAVERGDVRTVVDGDAYHLLDPGWQPALVIIDGDGTVLEAEPAGSAEAVRAGLAGFTARIPG
ncbi:hypothetical protein OHR68_39490 [Spirillospora sp. NBC_00431]